MKHNNTNATQKIRKKIYVTAVMANINKITGKKNPVTNGIGLATIHLGLVLRL